LAVAIRREGPADTIDNNQGEQIMTLKSQYLAAAAAVAIGLAAGAVHAGGASQASLNATMKGVFPFNETIIGVTAPATGPTCPQTLAAGSVTSQLQLTNQGEWTFDGKGNLSIVDTGVLVTSPGTGEAADVAASMANCSGTYKVNADHTVDMAYTCGLAGGYVQFIVQSRGLLSPTNMLVAIPPAAGGQTRVLQELVGGNLAACAVIGENTNMMRVNGPGYSWPVAGD
jgi:hypothetical protein